MHEVVKKIIPLPEVTYLNAETPKDEVKKGLIIATGSAKDSAWKKRRQPYELGECSDWQGLLDAILATKADCVYATHGFSAQLARYLREQYNIKADVVKTAFGEDEEE